MKRIPFRKAYKSLIASLSFSSELRKMRRELNAKIDMPDTIAPPPPSHALGVNRWFKRRRISIAESYLTVVTNLDSRHSRSRLDALKVLADVSFHPSNLDLPLNRARVQMALIKEVVKNRQNKRRQLELLQDFSVSTRGQHQVIRKLCDELNIIVLPENGTRVEEFSYGWEDHVHDTATSGRKNPTQLVIDAFIKGISRITVTYGSMADLEKMEEAFEAGRILGIRVEFAIEFSMNVCGKRYHFMAILPYMENRGDIRRFFFENEERLAGFLESLEVNQAKRVEAVRRALDIFNATELPAINSPFPNDDLYRLPELTIEGLNALIPTVSINRAHLSEFLFSRIRPVLQNRFLLYKVKRSKAVEDLRLARIGEEEFRKIDETYDRLKKQVKNLSPDALLEKYFSDPSIIEYESVFDDIRRIKSFLKTSGCRLKILHPLEHGKDLAREVLTSYRGSIDEVEIYNTQDCVPRAEDEVLWLARLVNDLNAGAKTGGFPLYIPITGSDSTGRHPKIPGMGFVYADTLMPSQRETFLQRHLALPGLVSAMVKAGGEPVDEATAAAGPSIISLGKISEGGGHAAGFESIGENTLIPPLRAWRYLNPTVKNLIFAFIGFIVADSFIGPGYAILWLGITGFRNSIADLIASRGARLSEWKLRSINLDNVAQSLFWTGFSVPILGFVKANFDHIWPWAQDGTLFNLAKFFVISFANGLYLATHNTLRGFDRKVVRANFFRSVIAWPFATLFAPLGNWIGIPSIVQTKIWSDMVAGFIEGGGKYLRLIKLRKRNLEEIVPQVFGTEKESTYTSILDLLYLFREEPRTRSSLATLDNLPELAENLGKPNLDEDLASYVLSRYEPEMADDLVGLVADTLPALRAWLGIRIAKGLKEGKHGNQG